MKLTLSIDNTIVSIETPRDGYTVEEMVVYFKGLLVAGGYHPSSVESELPSCDITTWPDAPDAPD